MYGHDSLMVRDLAILISMRLCVVSVLIRIEPMLGSLLRFFEEAQQCGAQVACMRVIVPDLPTEGLALALERVPPSKKFLGRELAVEQLVGSNSQRARVPRRQCRSHVLPQWPVQFWTKSPPTYFILMP